jgi:cyclophilin family peptidyl-prolyl cis-trans isomerase
MCNYYYYKAITPRYIRLCYPHWLLLILIIITAACANESNHNQQTTKQYPTIHDSDAVVLIQTAFGEIKVQLYHQTPLHKQNFLKLVREGFYNHTTIHRIVKEFIIQGGDPLSRDPAKIHLAGEGGPGYEIPAEILPQFFHKRGALCAARAQDTINPFRRSNGSQFYIVHGRTYTAAELDTIEAAIRTNQRNAYIPVFFSKPENRWIREIDKEKLYRTRRDSFNRLETRIRKLFVEQFNRDVKVFQFPDSQRTFYQNKGGAPYLDTQYTVFGEVIEGMEVVDKIASLATNELEAPLQPIPMVMKILKE